MSEIELKFGVPGRAVGVIDRRLRQLGAHAQTIESHYWDSADRRLAGRGLALRVRKVRGHWEQTLKGSGPTPVERLEETVSRPGRWEAGGPPPELWMFAGSPAGSLLDDALATDKKMPALERIHATLVTRLAVQVEIEGAEIEIALDQGAIAAGSRTLALCELEGELKRGDPAGLITFARTCIDVHGLWLSTISKASRGDRLVNGNGGTRAIKAQPAELDEAGSGEEIFRAVLRSCLDQVLANASVIAEGGVDDEVVHQLRVGIHRLRTAWRELGDWSGPLGAGWEAPVAEVFRALGRYRDQRTIAAAMQKRLRAAGSPEPAVQPLAKSSSEDPGLWVRSPSFQHALLDLLAFLMAPVQASTAVARDSSPAAPERTVAAHLQRLHARLMRDARRFEKLGENDRHRVRKRLKRLRYLSELLASMYRPRRVRTFLDQIEPAQDELGRYMDLVVAMNLSKDTAEAGESRAWFNVGWLKAQLPAAARRCRRSLGHVAAAKPYWRQVRSGS